MLLSIHVLLFVRLSMMRPTGASPFDRWCVDPRFVEVRCVERWCATL